MITTTITFSAEKGGNAKTTDAINFARKLAELGHKVGIIDMDSQSHVGLCLNADDSGSDIGTCLRNLKRLELSDFSKTNHPNLFVLSNKMDLSDRLFFDLERQEPGCQYWALDMILKDTDLFDFLIIDTPRTLDYSAKNGIIASDYVIIPALLEPLSVSGVQNSVNFVDQLINSKLGVKTKLLGILPSKVDKRMANNSVCLDEFKKIAPVFNSQIRTNAKIPERQGHGKTVFEFKPGVSSNDFTSLVEETLNKINKLQYA